MASIEAEVLSLREQLAKAIAERQIAALKVQEDIGLAKDKSAADAALLAELTIQRDQASADAAALNESLS